MKKIDITFKDESVGIFTEDKLNNLWGGVIGIVGLKEGRCEIVALDGENVLKVIYPKERIGNDGQIRWSKKFENAY